jgi:hypothetical protein
MQRPSIVGTPPVHIGHGLANSVDFDVIAAAQRAKERGSSTIIGGVGSASSSSGTIWETALANGSNSTSTRGSAKQEAKQPHRVVT